MVASKARSLVKLLALAPGHRLARERVLDLLWPDLPPESAVNNLYQTLHAVRSGQREALGRFAFSTVSYGESVRLDRPTRSGAPAVPASQGGACC